MSELQDNAAQQVAQIDSSGAQAPIADQKKTSVPSKSVRNKKKEDHKKHLNKKVVQNRLNPRLDAKRHISEDDLAEVLEECRRTAMQQPVREVQVTVDTPALSDLCRHTVQYLYNVGKVQVHPEGSNVDIQNLKKVVVAQATAKVELARRHCGKTVNVSEVDYINRVEKRFTVLPKIMNAYVEQIGHFTLDGQMFVPKKLPPLTFKMLSAGQYMTTLSRSGPNGEERAVLTLANEHVATYVVNGVVNDALTAVAQGHGLVTWVPVSGIGDFRQLCEWYEDFISRCSRKAGNILQNVVFSKGEGTVAQLVGSRFCDRIQQLEIWCCKLLDQNTLQIGGLFQFGYESSDKYHDEAIACVTDRIDVEGMYQRIQRCQKL